jgi:hypothetical protein
MGKIAYRIVTVWKRRVLDFTHAELKDPDVWAKAALWFCGPGKLLSAALPALRSGGSSQGNHRSFLL